MRKLHYFNPGHEMAALNASPFYQPPRHVAKMQADLALLPAWYAAPEDEVLIFPPEKSEQFPPKGEKFQVELWGISPAAVHLFEKMNETCGWQLTLPTWRPELRRLGSRHAAHAVLSALLAEIPSLDAAILPRFFSDVDELEAYLIRSGERQIVKSPYSSSGRGLTWLPPEKLAQSERQIISGMLKRQSQISIEKVLDKTMDFSMHFEASAGMVHFRGLSIFKTTAKGVYEKSFLAPQSTLENHITAQIDRKLLDRVRVCLTSILQNIYTPYYEGNIGVDMLLYRSENRICLQPCVEINMRKSMGYLAIRLFENHLLPHSQGSFFVEYNKQPQQLLEKHRILQKVFPLHIENGRIKSGYLSLCPVNETTNYHAFVIIFDGISTFNLI